MRRKTHRKRSKTHRPPAALTGTTPEGRWRVRHDRPEPAARPVASSNLQLSLGPATASDGPPASIGALATTEGGMGPPETTPGAASLSPRVRSVGVVNGSLLPGLAKIWPRIAAMVAGTVRGKCASARLLSCGSPGQHARLWCFSKPKQTSAGHRESRGKRGAPDDALAPLRGQRATHHLVNHRGTPLWRRARNQHLHASARAILPIASQLIPAALCVVQSNQ